MFPWNLLDRRLRTTKFGRLSPIHVGISPDNPFFPRSISVSCEPFIKNEGNPPDKLLLYKLKDLILRRKVIESGILPKKLLLAKFRMARLSNWNQQSGSLPDNKLFERSRYVNRWLLIEHKNEIDPENLFLERFRDETLGGSSGIGPSN